MKKKLYIWVQIIIAATLLGVIIGNFVENLPKPEKKAKYIFLFIGDGMGFTQVAATESYLSYKEGKLGGERLLMSSFPYCGNVSNHSANRNVTCSAASGTAIACGEKTKNNMIGMNADSVAIYSSAHALKAEGYKIAIVSTSPVNHATPAAFYAHNISRSNAYEIAMDIVDCDYEYLAGAGFLDYKGKDGEQKDINEVLQESGYTISYDMEEFKALSGKTDKAIFCQPSSLDRNASNYAFEYNEIDSNLREMMEAGIEFLGDDEPFFFMCEGGLIDWCAHANSPMAVAHDVILFDDAIRGAYEFYLKHPDETLIIVTADHETGGMTLGTHSKSIDWKPLEDKWLESKRVDTQEMMANRELSDKCSIGWTSRSHTGAHVPIFAIGVGAEKFNGSMDNTDIKDKILCK